MRLIILLATLLLVAVYAEAKNSIFDQQNRWVSIKNDIEHTLRTQLTLSNLKTVSSRLPSAVGRSIKVSTKSFLSSSAILFPVGLAFNIKQFRPIDAWLMKGAGTSIEWAKLGACFAGAETFVATMRDKNDRLNAYLGSGVTSGLLRLQEGPVGVAQGFAVGYGFMYAIDKFAKPAPLPSPSIPTELTTSATSRSGFPGIGQRVVKLLPSLPKWK